MSARRTTIAIAALAAVALGLVGCSPSITERAASGAPGVVTIEGSLTGSDATLLQKSWAPWAKSNGITIKYTGSSDFESSIAQEAQGGNAPDLAIFAQPGIIGDLATRGYVEPLPAAVSANVKENFPAEWASYTTTGGNDYAAPLTASVNGWVYYSPKLFYSWGISIPSTWAQLVADTKLIATKTGVSPWCEGFSDGAQSGAAGASWIDDVVLREDGTSVYDQWVSHQIPFSDPRITKAFNDAGQILLNKNYVNRGLEMLGGLNSVNSATSADVAAGLASGKCAMAHETSSFVSSLKTSTGAPVNVSATGDFWAFPLPPVTAGQIPLTGGGTFVSAFSTDPDTVKVQTYLSSEAWATTRVKLGGVISPDPAIAASADTSALLTEATELLHNPSVDFRFDAADLMPSVVGSGSYLTGVVAWMDGSTPGNVAKSIDASWPN
jgi:alpha-glucoside transport system substrate-binding protein